MNEFMRAQYALIFRAVVMFLIEFRPYIPEGLGKKAHLEQWNRWMDSHGGEVNELVDILDTIVHTKYKHCQFTEKFVDTYFKVLTQLRKGLITHCEFASEISKQYNSMRSQLALAALKSKEVELVNFD